MSQQILFEFCLRLTAGLACAIVFLLGRGVGREFFRTLMLVTLGLSVLGWLNAIEGGVTSLALALCAVASFLGFVFWTLGRVALGAAAAIFLLGATLFCLTAWAFGEGVGWAQGADWFTGVSSAALLGSMVAAMLLGHTYLIAPGMSIDPLRAMVWWIAGAVGARSIATCISLARLPSLPPLSSALDWMLGGRILIGLVGPAIIAWMVWQTARIRSTQSATGILYAGVVLAFLGELLGQLLGM